MNIEPDNPAGAQLIARAFDILRVISRGPSDGRRLSELCRITGLKEATARRILRALIFERMVSQDPSSRRYRLGPLAFELGLVPNPYQAALRQCDVLLQEVAHETGDSAFFCMRSGTELVCLARSEGSFPIRASMVNVGGRLPLGVGALGVSLLAALPPDEASRLLSAVEREYTSYTGLNRSVVEQKIEEARRDGFSNFPNQPMVGIQSVGMTVASAHKPYIMGVATVAIVARFTEEHLQLTLRMLKKCAEAIGHALG